MNRQRTGHSYRAESVPISRIRQFLFRLAFSVNLGPLNPWLIGVLLGRKPREVDGDHSPERARRAKFGAVTPSKWREEDGGR